MVYNVTINHKAYEVEVEEGRAELLRTQAVQDPVITPVQATAVPKTVVESNAQTAPMPGVILEINAIKGQKVKENDLLLVLEAMKMENEVFASQDGVVKEIYVQKGANVNTDDPLILIV